MTEAQKNKKRTLLIPVMIALIGVVGGMLGYALQYLVVTHQEQQKNLIESRTSAYAKYFEGQTKYRESVYLKNQGMKDEAEKLDLESSLLLNESNFRIGIFGTRPVIEAIAANYEKYLTTTPPIDDKYRQQWIDEIKIYQRMRDEVFGGNRDQKVDDRVLLILLFKIRLNK